MYKLFMALRYLASHRIIYFSIFGVAIGIAVIIIVMSVMGGFSRDIRERIRGMQAHLVVKGISNDILILDYGRLTDRLAKLPHVKGAAPRVEYVAWMGVRGREMDVHLIGIDPSRERGASQLQMFFEKGGKRNFDFKYDDGEAPTYPGMVVGVELARIASLREIPGLTTVRRETRPRICNANFEVVGKFNSGMVEYDTGFVFMDLVAAQRFLKYRCVHEPEIEDCPDCRQRPAVSYLAVMVDDYEANAGAVRQSILELLHSERACRSPEMHRYGWCGLYEIRTWEEQKAALLRAVSIEKGIQVVILFFIILVAGFNIIAFYTLMVKAKTREIGILRALGSNRAGISQVFLTSGFLCGLFGSVVGIIVGLKMSYNLNGIAECVEQTSKDVAAWGRLHTDSFLARYGVLAGCVSIFAMLIYGVSAILLRLKWPTWSLRSWLEVFLGTLTVLVVGLFFSVLLQWGVIGKLAPPSFESVGGVMIGSVVIGTLLYVVSNLLKLVERFKWLAFRVVFGGLAVALVSLAGMSLLADALKVARPGDRGFVAVFQFLRWIFAAVFVLAYWTILVADEMKVPIAKNIHKTSSALIWIAYSIVVLAMIGTVVSFFVNNVTWEMFFGELVFDIIGALGSVLLLRALLRYSQNLVLPTTTYVVVMLGILIALPFAMLVMDPPGPGWMGWNLFPKDVYYLDRIPAEVNYPSILLVVGATMLVSIAATLYPAIRAAMCDPIEAIRRE